MLLKHKDAGVNFTTYFLTLLGLAVDWVENLFNTKLYHLWSIEQVRHWLLKAGLEEKDLIACEISGDTLLKINQNSNPLEYLNSTFSTSLDVNQKILSFTSLIANPITFSTKKIAFAFFDDMANTKKFNLRLGECFTDSEIKTYQNRESFLALAKHFIQTHINEFKANLNGPVSQQRFRFGNCFNGSGCGKTRALREFKNCALQLSKKTLLSYISFSNGSELSKTENSLLESDKADIVLGWRIFCSFCSLGMGGEEVLKSNIDYFHFENVIHWICLHVDHHDQDDPLKLIVAIDEYQKVFRIESIRTKLLHIIGTAGCNPLGANEFTNKYNVCIIPIIAGTILDTDVRKTFEVTGYGRSNFYLTPLQTNHCKQVFFDICSHTQLISSDGQIIDAESLWNYGDFSLFYSQIAMIPKQAVLFHDSIVEYCTTSVDSWNTCLLHNRVSDLKRKLLSIAKIESEILYPTRELYDLLISGNAVNTLQNNDSLVQKVNELINRGVVYLSSSHSIYYTWYHFLNLLERYNLPLHKLLSSFSYLTLSGNEFETIGIFTLISRMNNLVNSKCEFVTLSTLFPNVETTTDIDVLLPPFRNEYAEELDYFLPKKNQKTTKSGKKDKNKNRVGMSIEYENSPITNFLNGNEQSASYVYLSKPNQKLVDARWFTFDRSKSKVIVLIQWKLRKSGKLSIDEVISLGDYNNLKNRYVGCKVFYILITTADVSPIVELSSRPGICDDYKKHVLFVDRQSIMANFSPNIMPYLGMIR